MNTKHLKYFFSLVAAVMIPASTSAQIVPYSYFYIVAKHSNKCAQVNGASGANGAVISQWDCLNQNNVKWYLYEAGEGYLYIRAKHNNKCAQVNRASGLNGAVISQWDCVNQNNVKWYLVGAQPSIFR